MTEMPRKLSPPSFVEGLLGNAREWFREVVSTVLLLFGGFGLADFLWLHLFPFTVDVTRWLAILAIIAATIIAPFGGFRWGHLPTLVLYTSIVVLNLLIPTVGIIDARLYISIPGLIVLAYVIKYLEFIQKSCARNPVAISEIQRSDWGICGCLLNRAVVLVALGFCVNSVANQCGLKEYFHQPIEGDSYTTVSVRTGFTRHVSADEDRAGEGIGKLIIFLAFYLSVIGCFAGAGASVVAAIWEVVRRPTAQA